MGKLIEQQAVIDCLTNTAKYYDMPQADEWTKGIHYGLLHGIDNILDNVKPVEAIPKDQYEARLKADMVAILKDLDLQIDELSFSDEEPINITQDYIDELRSWEYGKNGCKKLIQQKINSLKGE